MMNKLYFGNPEFTKKVTKIYSWVIPVIFILMTCLFLVSQAWITALCFGGVILLCLPPFNSIYQKFRLGSFTRLIFGVILILLAIYSTGVYL